MTLIGITGYKGSGKTTAASALYSIGYTRVRFADTLKSMLRLLGLTDSQIDGDEKELPLDLLGGKSPRYAMQTLGTEWGRDLIDRNLWVNVWKKKVLETAAPVVADDVRFYNEAETLLQLGGHLLHIDRSSAAASPHPSEDLSWLGNVSHTRIPNDGTLEELKFAIRQFGFGAKG